MQRIVRARASRRGEADVAAGLLETLALARARGETVETVGGKLRVSNRDGMRSLRDAGHIDEAQYAIGLLYRQGFEARGRDLRSASLEPGRGGGHNNDRFVAARLRRARSLDFVIRADRAVAMGLADKPMALRLLRAVAGEGDSLSSFGVGRSFVAHRQVFIEALSLVVSLSKQIARDRKSGTIHEQID